MKKYLILASAALVALASCTLEINPSIQDKSNEENTVVLTFSSERPQHDDPSAKETKTEWNTNKIVWSVGDKIRVGYTKDGDWMAKSAPGQAKFYSSTEVSIDGENESKGTFSVPVTDAFSDPGVSGTYQFFAVYPGSILGGTDVADPTAKSVTLPSTQSPVSGSFDKSADILIGQTEAQVLSGLPDTPLQLSWTRVVAHADLTFSNLAFDGAEVVHQIILTFNEDAKVAGSVSLNIPAGTAGSGNSNVITLSSGFNTTSNSTEVWACLLPVTFTSLNVVIKTDKATYTRTITGISKTFKKNARNGLTINMSTATREEDAPVNYELYSGTLIEGDYVIYDATDGHALKAAIASNRFSYEEVTPSARVISTNDQTIVWHIAESASNPGYYTIYNAGENKYAAATGSNNQGQLLADDTDNKSLWSISGTFDFINKSNSRYLRSNGASGFACYASSTGAPLTLYLHDMRTPLDAPASVTAALNGSTSNAIDVTFSSVTDADTYVIVATPTSSGDPVVKDDVTSNSATIDGLAYNTEYTISVYAVPAPADAVHKRSAATAAASNVTTGDAPALAGAYYVKVSSTPADWSGEYLLVCENQNVALSEISTTATKYGIGAAVTISDGKVASDNTVDAYKIVIASATSGGSGYTLKFGSRYLYWSTGNSLDANASESNNSRWTITAGATAGNWILANVADNAREIWYNTSSPRFACYTGKTEETANYAPVQLYKLVDNTPRFSVSSPLDITSDADTYNISVSRSNFTGAITVTVPNECTWLDADNVAACEDNFDIMVDENTSGALRTVTLTLSGAGVESQTLVVNQAAPATPDFTTIAQLNVLAGADATNYTGTLTNATVSFVPNGDNAIIKDATGSVLLYKTGHGLSQGQTFSGETTVTIKLYNSCSELTACDANFTGNTTVVAPATVSLSALVGHLSTYQNAYVQVDDLEVTGVSSKNITVTDGANTYVVYSSAGNATCVVGDVISVVGTIAHFGDNDQIKAWTMDAITVTYHPTSHAVTFSQPGAGGSFVVSAGGSAISSGTNVQEGTTITITATPLQGYTFSGWNVTGATVADASAATTTFTMGTSPVTISAAFAVSGSTSSFTIASADVVSGTSYKAHTATVDTRSWVITFGGNNKSVGTNSGNRTKCTLSSYTEYAVSPVTTSSIASAFASTSSIANVSKISYTFNGGSNQTSTKVYLLYSSDNTTFTQVSLTKGTQGATISSGTEFEFAKCSGYFAVLFEATNASGNWRIDDVNLTFTYDN